MKAWRVLGPARRVGWHTALPCGWVRWGLGMESGSLGHLGSFRPPKMRQAGVVFAGGCPFLIKPSPGLITGLRPDEITLRYLRAVGGLGAAGFLGGFSSKAVGLPGTFEEGLGGGLGALGHGAGAGHQNSSGGLLRGLLRSTLRVPLGLSLCSHPGDALRKDLGSRNRVKCS